MSTPFQTAMGEYVRAFLLSKEDRDAVRAKILQDESNRALSEAGDALESVLRQMMREEAYSGESCSVLSREHTTKSNL